MIRNPQNQLFNQKDCCIACGSSITTVRSYSGNELIQALTHYFNNSFPTDVHIDDYKIAQCNNCGIEFSVPMVPGCDDFYKWITSQKGYYPTERWEFYEVQNIINQAASINTVSVLDVGCGSGDFLKRLKGNSGLELLGLDTTKKSVDACIAKGVDAYCCDIQTFKLKNPTKQFDYVVSFHCVEHVEHPKQFIIDMASVLRPSGTLLISAPLSPMSFETSWFDPLNHPPHHLTRFTSKSLLELAKSTNLNVNITSSPSKSSLKNTINTLKLLQYGPLKSIDKMSLFLLSLSDLDVFIREFTKQRKRFKTQGRLAGDTFLASFKKIYTY